MVIAPKQSWPHGYRFAFTIFDDTDWATVEAVKPVYDLLAQLGMRTTKSVWVLKGLGQPLTSGATCEDEAYLDWVLDLYAAGFEVGLHCVAPTTSDRQRTLLGLNRFRDLFGDYAIVHCNHASCRENIYWGDARVSGWRRALYNALTKGQHRGVYRGHLEGDPLFWGDLCKERVAYVRNFVFREVNTLSICPEMPYHDSRRPFVNFWFASTDGANLPRFLRTFTYRNIDRLVDEGGLCIAYVHFAAGFVRDGRVNLEFRERLEYIASKRGWFAPVSQVLDYLRGGQDHKERSILPGRLCRLELRWLVSEVIDELRKQAGKYRLGSSR